MYLKKIYINKIVLDSRKIKSGNLFLAINGNILDGRNFINEAINKGAAAVFAESEKNNIFYRKKNNIPIFYIPNLKKKISYIAGNFYNHPSKKINVIAVTGTNGKTTVSNLLYQWGNLLGEKSAFMGTNGNGYENNLIITKNTTDSALKTQKFLYYFLNKGVKNVSLEASSHGLFQHRLESLNFSSVVFINLTHDHLDYHHNMKNYELSKWILFSKYKVDNIIINTDDKIGYKWIHRLKNAVAVSINKKFFNIKKRKFWLKVINIEYLTNKTIIEFDSTWGSSKISNYLLGKFNITNILLSLTTLLKMGYPLKLLTETSNYLTPVYGRMEFFKSFKKANFIIDYAHTPDALKNTLKSCRLYCKNNLWCIFGCGGNRDIYKRSVMGKIAKKYSDFVIVTNDNPRNEDAKNIIKEIISQLKNKKNLFIIPERNKAISYAFDHSKKNDLILIAGKGHENYQIIGNKYFYYSDKQTVINLLKK